MSDPKLVEALAEKLCSWNDTCTQLDGRCGSCISDAERFIRDWGLVQIPKEPAAIIEVEGGNDIVDLLVVDSQLVQGTNRLYHIPGDPQEATDE